MNYTQGQNKEYQVGSVANNGEFYTPKYFVAKFKESSDILMNTANKGLGGCRFLTESIYPDNLDDIVIVLVEVKNVTEEYFEF